jgi:hypothetical protein
MTSGQKLLRRLKFLLAVGCLCTTEAIAGVTASGDGSNPSTTTQHVGDENGFEITEDVAYDPSAGLWIKQLINDPNGVPIVSGTRVNITETLTNTGTSEWTDWHEEILTTTGGEESPLGFLFDKNSLNLMADYGSGFLALIEGVDYTVVEMDYLGPGWDDDNMGLEAIWIFFEPHAVIQAGDELKIEKQIFEVFLDGDVWDPGELVEIAQYPTVPEPSTFVLGTIGLLGLGCRRRKRV